MLMKIKSKELLYIKLFEETRYEIYAVYTILSQIANNMGPAGPRWTLRWPHEPCYQGWYRYAICSCNYSIMFFFARFCVVVALSVLGAFISSSYLHSPGRVVSWAQVTHRIVPMLLKQPRRTYIRWTSTKPHKARIMIIIIKMNYSSSIHRWRTTIKTQHSGFAWYFTNELKIVSYHW